MASEGQGRDRRRDGGESVRCAGPRARAGPVHVAQVQRRAGKHRCQRGAGGARPGDPARPRARWAVKTGMVESWWAAHELEVWTWLVIVIVVALFAPPVWIADLVKERRQKRK